MRIIAFVGMPASGKSEASLIAQNRNIPVVNMGDVVREEAAKYGLPPTDKNIGGTGTKLRNEEGMDVIAKRCVPKIRKLDSDIVVIDGIRNIDEINHFKEQFGNDFMLVAIDTPLEVRLERVKNRGRSDDMNSIAELQQRDEREKSWGLDKAIEMAEVTIDNTSTLEEFRSEIVKLFGKL